MLNGFYAKWFEEELPSKNMFVSFMVDQQDITPELEKSGINSMDRKEASSFSQRRGERDD